MERYRIVFDAYERTTGKSALLAIVVKSWSPRSAVASVHTLYYSPETGTVNTHGGFGPNGEHYSEWHVVSVRKDRAAEKILFVGKDGNARYVPLKSLAVTATGQNSLARTEHEAVSLARSWEAQGDGFAIWGTGIGDVCIRDARFSSKR